MKLWIARDKSGGLWLFRNKPVYVNYWKDTLNVGVGELDYRLFSEVTFENSPQMIELKLKNELSFEEMEELIDDLI